MARRDPKLVALTSESVSIAQLDGRWRDQR
jgi:hypothetical protein